jgi:hypothetical protein
VVGAVVFFYLDHLLTRTQAAKAWIPSMTASKRGE